MSVYFYGCVTLDGYLADKNHGLNWLYETGSPEITTAAKFYKKMDITIMGRRTFNEVKESLTEKMSILQRKIMSLSTKKIFLILILPVSQKRLFLL